MKPPLNKIIEISKNEGIHDLWVRFTNDSQSAIMRKKSPEFGYFRVYWEGSMYNLCSNSPHTVELILLKIRDAK